MIEFTSFRQYKQIIYTYHTNHAKKNLSIISMCFTWLENILGDNPLVSGSAIIWLVPICSIDTLCFDTYYLTDKYIKSMCFAPAEYLSFLEKKIVVELSQ